MMGLSLSSGPFLLPPRPNGIEDTERRLYLQFSIYFSFFVAPNRYRKIGGLLCWSPRLHPALYRYVFSIIRHFPSPRLYYISHGGTAFKKPNGYLSRIALLCEERSKVHVFEVTVGLRRYETNKQLRDRPADCTE